jgi:two-component system sensor histidine kinase SenX3
MRVLPVLPQTSIVVDSSGAVLNSCLEAQALGIVTGDRLTNPEVMSLAGEVARTGLAAERDIELVHPSFGRVAREMYMRAAPVSPQVTLILLEDLSESRRVDAVRRDFVDNVSHVLKTPVGALGILAEAVEAASDEPEEVRHFARRMRIESQRLAALVNDIIDLSRLQGDNPLEHANVVSIDRVTVEAIDATRLAADAKAIDVIRGGTSGLTVFGEENHLITALRNLISNAINYSPERTRIAVGTRLIDGVVEMSVTDQGIGISADEQSRIFERFYRVDQARSRGTGGTGLGLAIVKHVCVNHGGEVTVWSRTGEGSTFTIRIPAQASLAASPQSVLPTNNVVVDLAATSEKPTIIEAAS